MASQGPSNRKKQAAAPRNKKAKSKRPQRQPREEKAETAPGCPLTLPQQVAALTLAGNWPEGGNRQNAAVALAGGLAKAGWMEAAIVAFLQIVTKEAGDDVSENHGEIVRLAAEGSKAEGQRSGWSTLSNLIGRTCVRRLQEALFGALPERSMETKRKPESLATRLVTLVEGSGVELFRDQSRKPYASIPIDGHWENWPLESSAFSAWLSLRALQENGEVPNGTSMSDAVNVLRGRAQYQGSLREVHLRLAQHEGKIYLDLCDPAWRAVEIDTAGWRIVERPPVSFLRTAGMLALPEPVHGGNINELGDILNLGDERCRKYAIGWLVGALRAKGPYSLLALHGVHGSAKTMTAAGIRYLVDPNALESPGLPRNEDDLLTTAMNSYVLTFDNVSGVTPRLSDAFCRISTGGGLSKRQHYTNCDVVQLNVMRPVIINGIDPGLITQPDLLSRTIPLELPQIPEECRRTKEDVWRRLEDARPRLLGALLKAVVTALQRQDCVTLPRMPRMADFALWVEQSSPALGWREGEFTELLFELQQEEGSRTLSMWPVMEPLGQLLLETGGVWEGTMGNLGVALNAVRGSVPRPDTSDWPRSPRALSEAIKRHELLLRREGIEIRRPPRSNGRSSIRITQVGAGAPPPASGEQPAGSDEGDGQ
jgi:hypothetical protein